MSGQIIQLGIVGIALIVMWKLLDLVKLWWVTRDGKAADGAGYMTRLQCMVDPAHFERIKTMARQVDWIFGYSKDNEPTLRTIREKVPAGDFGCTWKDRDEVLQMIQTIKDNTEAQEAVAKAVNDLTTELRKQNGGK